MPLDTILTFAGAGSALFLIGGLILGLRGNSRWRIWPAPPIGSLKSFAFWTLFRTLNVVVLILAIERFTAAADTLTLVQIGFAAVSAVAGVAYLYALWSLGRKATYCQASGLATDGVYRWTRNPQYATAIVAFGALGLAVAAWYATALAAALVAVYALMAIAEEPWLEARYGRAYLDYRVEVPRFFNLRHAWAKLSGLISRQTMGRKPPSFANGRRTER